jgi:hypothetical protein
VRARAPSAHSLLRLETGSKLMGDNKSKAESQFNREAIRESIERMKPDFDRVIELGSLVECLGGMCGPHLLPLHEIAHALDEVHETESEGERPYHRHH